MNLKTLQKGLVGVYVLITSICVLIAYNNYSAYDRRYPVAHSSILEDTRIALEGYLSSRNGSGSTLWTDQNNGEISGNGHSGRMMPAESSSVLLQFVSLSPDSRMAEWRAGPKDVQRAMYPFLKALSTCTSIFRRFDVAYIPGMDDYIASVVSDVIEKNPIKPYPVPLQDILTDKKYHHVSMPTIQILIFPFELPQSSTSIQPFRLDGDSMDHIIALPTRSLPEKEFSLTDVELTVPFDETDAVVAIARLASDVLRQYFGLSSIDLSATDTDAFCSNLHDTLVEKATTSLRRYIRSQEIGLFPMTRMQERALATAAMSMMKHFDTKSPQQKASLQMKQSRIEALNELISLTEEGLTGGSPEGQLAMRGVLTQEFQLGIHGPLMIPILLGLLRVVLPMVNGCVDVKSQKNHLLKQKSP